MHTYTRLQWVGIPICIDSDDLIYPAIHSNGARRETAAAAAALLHHFTSFNLQSNLEAPFDSRRKGREGAATTRTLEEEVWV